VAGPPIALVLGSVSCDLAADGPPAPGGVVVHAGRALARLGARTRVCTRVRADDRDPLLGGLVDLGVEVLALPSAATTIYLNAYGDGDDRHVLRAASDPIGPDDVPAAWRRADVIHVGPLHPADLDPGTGAVLRGFRGLDVQGLVRMAGTTTLRACPTLAAHLAHADVVQASEVELPAMLAGDDVGRFVARHGLGELLVTRGARGVTVITAAGALDVPAAAGTVHGGPGAGDVFLAAYLLARVRGSGPGDAARAGAAAAADARIRGPS
jgi:sugar/nucleoside kinase (ribokinase family)